MVWLAVDTLHRIDEGQNKGVNALSGKFGHARPHISQGLSKWWFGKGTALFCALNQITAFGNRKALAAVLAVALLYCMSACADGNTLPIAVIGPLS